jgi:hypothetical protein
MSLFGDGSDDRPRSPVESPVLATIVSMAASPTKRVEFDSELPESMARMTLGRETLRRVQERNALTEDEAIELGVKAVHEARHERRASG